MSKASKLDNKIRVLRAETKMSQKELASLVGVRRETIGSLENGKYNPSLLLVMAIADVFDVSIDELFKRERKNKS